MKYGREVFLSIGAFFIVFLFLAAGDADAAPKKKKEKKPLEKIRILYTVKKDDTLSGIGKRYGTKAAAILAAENNRYILTRPLPQTLIDRAPDPSHWIFPGDKIVITVWRPIKKSPPSKGKKSAPSSSGKAAPAQKPAAPEAKTEEKTAPPAEKTKTPPDEGRSFEEFSSDLRREVQNALSQFDKEFRALSLGFKDADNEMRKRIVSLEKTAAPDAHWAYWSNIMLITDSIFTFILLIAIGTAAVILLIRRRRRQRLTIIEQHP